MGLWTQSTQGTLSCNCNALLVPLFERWQVMPDFHILSFHKIRRLFKKDKLVSYFEVDILIPRALVNSEVDIQYQLSKGLDAIKPLLQF